MTTDQRIRFLREMARTGNVQLACAAAEVTRADAYADRLAHPSFERQWRHAVSDSRATFRQTHT